MTVLDKIAGSIIKEQELIIGPLAWSQAAKVPGLHITNQDKGELSIDAGPEASGTIDNLVAQYEKLFGLASREVCKEAAAGLLSGLSLSEIPVSLR